MIVFLVIVGISVLILIHELGHFIAAKLFGLWVEEFGFGFPPRLFSKKIGETVYSFNLLPFGGFVKIYGEDRSAAADGQEQRSFYAQTAWKKIAIILAGVFMNFVIGWLIISSVLAIGAPRFVILTQVAPDTPAAVAGLLAGDALLDFSKGEDFFNFIQEHRGREVVLKINRAGRELSVKVTPREAVPDGQGALGVSFTESGVERQPVFRSLAVGFQTSLAIVAMIFTSLFQIILALFTQSPILANFVGPVGIFGVANQAGVLGLVYVLQLIGLISLNLFALNIFPFPALDGGRLLFIVIEKIKGSPLSSKFERSANAAGFIFLILLMVAITVRDIVRLF